MATFVKTLVVDKGLIQSGTTGSIDLGADTTGSFANTALKVKDTDASNTLAIVPGSNLSADRTLTVTTGDSDRTLTLTGNASISGTNTGDQTITLTGNVTGSGTGSFAATIANDAVTYAKMQNISAASKLLGRGSASGSGDCEEITLGTGLTMTGTTLSSSGGLSDSDYGDITVSSSGTVMSIDNNAVTDAKLRDSGACSVVGRSANSSGDPADITASTNGHYLRRSSDSVGFGAIAATDLPTHASRHQSGGADAIKLDDLAAPDDNTDLNATSSAHGLLPKLANTSGTFLNSYGNWTTPQGMDNNPTGAVLMFAGTSGWLPTGYLFCDGAAVSRTTYSSLYTILGTTWGAGDGSTTFNLPNLCGRAPIGVGTGSGLTARSLGGTGGAETHVLSVGELATHGHTPSGDAVYRYTGTGTDGWNWSVSGGGNAQATIGITIPTAGSNTAHNNMQPWAAIGFIIKTGV